MSKKDGEATVTSDAGILGQSIRGRVNRKHTGLKDIFHVSVTAKRPVWL